MTEQQRQQKSSEMRPYIEGEDLTGVSISDVDRAAGSPKVGDMIARDINNHADQWLVAAKFEHFLRNGR